MAYRGFAWVATVLIGGVIVGSGCAAQPEPPSLRDRLVQNLRSDPEYKDFTDKQVECLADGFIKYAEPEAIEQIMQDKTPADDGWKPGVDGNALTEELAACSGPSIPSPTG
ncbi:hypothetical protein [Nonomuraea aurantiaca]|uniref:hypothetical protein n=1 Tax=Nonomuraea aurantiaca TaxID=2878562 RepID=UPI001CD9A456|nr:hypothetical protein [Nonomuraea aurantiaca]MCA2226337.1 hypothetical protein [Nonomuraea aurantiaca]